MGLGIMWNNSFYLYIKRGNSYISSLQINNKVPKQQFAHKIFLFCFLINSAYFENLGKCMIIDNH